MAFWAPNTSGVHLTNTTLDRGDGAALAVNAQNALLSISEQRRRLPAFQHRRELLYAVERYRVTIVVGETGSGKTTQIPQYLYEAGWGGEGWCIACTQPRRIAATSVARRVAEEMNCALGAEVGYSVRFDSLWSPEKTKVKFLTDGLLIREMMLDPLLSRYSVVMLDEAHERSLHTDVLVGLLKKVMKRRDDLRLIVSSATVNADEFRDFFETNKTRNHDLDTSCVMSIEGRTHPVDIHYLPEPSSNYLDTALQTVVNIHLKEPPGDVLVFMSGQDEIEALISLLHERAATFPRGTLQLKALPLFAGLSKTEQQAVFQTVPKNCRKVVVATNIAETSITIDGIKSVVDAGFVKIRAYDAKTGMEALVVIPESQSSAVQRAGRAGRIAPGKAYRLMTEDTFASLPDTTVPEMQRCNLISVVLQLKALGIDNILQFPFMSSPSAEAMARALELLYALGALDDACKLTSPTGMSLAEFPTDPRIAKCILASGEAGCSEEILTIAAMVSVESVFVSPSGMKAAARKAKFKFIVAEGDHITYLNVYNAYKTIAPRQRGRWCSRHFINAKAMARVVDVRNQLRSYARRAGVVMSSCGRKLDTIRRTLIRGYFSNAARLRPDGSYQTAKDNQILYLSPESVLFHSAPQWVIYHEVVLTARPFMRDITVVDPKWLAELAPHFYEYRDAAGRRRAIRRPRSPAEDHSLPGTDGEGPGAKARRIDQS